ncbi:MAG: hypothetical protein JWM11_2074 [Planctomycetaceae bacterium]|nr:hypothetical protein [Planctomycetaceae bacterium]
MSTALRTLQKLRQIELDRCRVALGTSQRHEQEIKELLEATRATQAKQLTDLKSLTSAGPIPVSMIRLRHEHLADLADQVGELDAAILTAERETQARIEVLVAAERQFKVAKKLQQRSNSN